MTVQDDDQLLVCRNSTPYNLKSQNVMAELLDDDLMLVCRNGTPYKATGLEIKESIGPQEAPPSLTSVTLTEDTPGGSRFDNQSFTSTLNWATKGVPEASLAMKATVTGTLDIAGSTDEITSFVDSPPTITDATQIASAVEQITVYDDVGGSTQLVYSGAETPEGILGLKDYPDLWTPVNPNPYKNNSNLAAGFKLIASEPLSITCIGDAPFKLLTTSNTSGGGAYSYTITGNVTVTGTTGGSAGRYDQLSDEVTITPNTSGATFTITLNSGGMYINHVPLGGDTYFTLASDANLANGAFKAGDVVKQDNSPIVPTSSAITNVSNSTVLYEAGAFTDPSSEQSTLQNTEKVFDGDALTNNNLGAFTGYVYFPAIQFTQVTEVIVYLYVEPAGNVSSGKIRLNPGGAEYLVQEQEILYHYGSIPGGDTFIGKIRLKLNGVESITQFGYYTGGNHWISGIEVNGQLLTNGERKMLTLTNSDGLSDFELGDVVTPSPTPDPVTLDLVGITNAASRWRVRDENDNQLYDSISDSLASFNDIYNNTIVNQLYWVDDPNVVCPNNTNNPGIFVGGGGATTGGKITWNYTAPAAGTQIAIILGGYNYSASMKVGGDVNEAGTNLQVFNTVSVTPRYRFILTTTGTTGSFSLTWNNSDVEIVYLLYAGPSSPTSAEVVSISDTAAEMTVSGGTWNLGEVVTGPTKNITATFVSADPSVPSMTVSDVVGPWSANTGNYVVNTVVNPVMIKPETSAITNVADVVGPTYSSDVTADQGYTDNRGPDKGFDGNTQATGGQTYCQAGASNAYVQWNPSITIDTATQPVVVWGISSTDQITATGSTGTQTIAATNNSGGGNPLPDVGVLTSIKVQNPTGFGGFSGIAVDGNLLIDGVASTVLTLTDNTDLNQFATGDEVYANTAYTPTTSAITNVNGNILTLTDDTDLENFRQGDVVGVEPDTTDPKFSIDVTNNPPIDITGNLNSYEHSGGTFVETAPANSFGITNCWYFDGTESNYLRWSGVTMPNQYTLDYYYYAESGQTSNSRTLEIGSSKPYDDFGGTSSRTIRVRQVSGDTYTDYPVTAVGNGWNHIRVSNTGIWHNGNLVDGSPRNMAGYIADKVQISRYSNSVSYRFKGYIGPARLASVDLGAPPAGGLVLKDSKFGDPIIVNAVDADNNTMLVSGGTWNVGDVVTGPTFTGTGTVASTDPAGPTMTLSTSTRWATSTKVTMDEKPAVETTANLIFDSTGAVSGLTTSDVAGQLMSNKDTPALTFGDGAGTGETWDEELPAGTHLQTSFVATNVEGTSSATSNEITPQ